MLMTSDLLEPIDETDMSYRECSVALVLGNGESRAWFNPSETKIQTTGVVTWGCNAIYRDGDVNNLVAIDYGIQQEIHDSGYHKWSKCWFADWNVLPASAADGLLMGFDFPENFIHKSKNVTDQCVIAGTDPVTLNEKIESAIKQFPNLDMKDLQIKMNKDVGVWITYVNEDDGIRDIDFPKKWAAGTTALHLACQDGAKEVYMVGFDLSSPDKLINNSYKGTDYYFPEDARGFTPVSWMKQLGIVFNEFPDTQFYWVGREEDGVFLEKNIRYLTKEEICDKLKIV